MRIYPRPDWPFKIIEEQAVTDAIAIARDEFPRFEEIWDGLMWLIAHGGHKIGAEERSFGGVGHYLYTFEGDAVAGYPRIVVAYKYGLGTFTLRLVVISRSESN